MKLDNIIGRDIIIAMIEDSFLPNPIRKQCDGSKSSIERLRIAGASLRAVKSPDAPKITITVGGGEDDKFLETKVFFSKFILKRLF